MCDEWMPQIQLTLTPQQFRQLPRNPAFKYELLGGQVFLTPRPKHFHALLDLRSPEADVLAAGGTPEGVTLRAVATSDWASLAAVFSGAFRTTQPFGSLDDETRLQAAKQSLKRTATGGDGPWIQAASFVADENGPVGAILITLLPPGDPCEYGSYYWNEPPPPDVVEQRLGRPHLTWVFVVAQHRTEGVGTALLSAAVRRLRDMGFAELATTFLLGNDSSALWHWRNGFRLLPFPGSRRRTRSAGPAGGRG
jgi:GNAT superfamily N-acetyltransferase